MTPQNMIGWASFGTDSWTKYNLKVDRKLDQQSNQIHVDKLMRFFCFLVKLQFADAETILFGKRTFVFH